jgi:guanylate kinase
MPVLELAISATTRARRRGEQEGREYYFLSDEEFERGVEAGEFLEWVEYVGNRYGTLRSELDRIRGNGKVPLLDLEIEGALRVRDTVPGAVAVFVDAPIPELERRLHERATESAGDIEERVAIARGQKTHADEFDYIVVNDALERATNELAGIVERQLDAAGTISRP